MNTSELKQRMEHVQQRINQACERSKRDPANIQLIGVTKYVSADRAAEAAAFGLKHLGENRWPDAKEKTDVISEDVRWHYIGQLQTRKVRQVVHAFHYIHSLDRMSLAEELNKRMAGLDRTMPCFVQVNISGERSKAGLEPEAVPEFIRSMNEFEHLEIIGLMTMAPFESKPEETRPVFRGLRELRDELNQKNAYRQPIADLSMGMSNDFEIAVEEGATWLRLGSVLIGQASEE